MDTKSDALGRVVLPAPIRHQLGIVAGDKLDLQFDGGSITIKPLRALCAFCGQPATQEVEGRGICGAHVKAVKGL